MRRHNHQKDRFVHIRYSNHLPGMALARMFLRDHWCCGRDDSKDMSQCIRSRRWTQDTEYYSQTGHHQNRSMLCLSRSRSGLERAREVSTTLRKAQSVWMYITCLKIDRNGKKFKVNDYERQMSCTSAGPSLSRVGTRPHIQ